MFKEEMRLFPMMDQGGSTLIGLLIDDLMREHSAHAMAIARLEALAAGLRTSAQSDGTSVALRAGLAKLAAGLREHVHLEDEVPFPRFSATPRSPALPM